MNLELLRQKIDDSNIKKGALKEAIGCTYSTLSRKIDGKSDFTVKEMEKIVLLLRLTKSEKDKIFFG